MFSRAVGLGLVVWGIEYVSSYMVSANSTKVYGMLVESVHVLFMFIVQYCSNYL